MKKLLVLVMAFTMLLTFVSCSDNADNGNTVNDANDYSDDIAETEPDDGSIELTLDNYDTYIGVSASVGNHSREGDFYVQLTTSGKSDNFNYNDVVVTFEVEGECMWRLNTMGYSPEVWQSFKEEFTVELEITGDYLEDHYVMSVNQPSKEMYTLQNLYKGDDDENDTYVNYKIIDISGTVTPA